MASITAICSLYIFGIGPKGLGFKSGCAISAESIVNSPKNRLFTVNSVEGRCPMKCQRCIEGKEVRYRVYSDVIDMQVCPSCAAEAQSLRLTIELLPRDEVKRVDVKGEFSNSKRDMVFLVDSPAI
jgi:hypothetical protein